VHISCELDEGWHGETRMAPESMAVITVSLRKWPADVRRSVGPFDHVSNAFGHLCQVAAVANIWNEADDVEPDIRGQDDKRRFEEEDGRFHSQISVRTC